jgi:hypothetical protein
MGVLYTTMCSCCFFLLPYSVNARALLPDDSSAWVVVFERGIACAERTGRA